MKYVVSRFKASESVKDEIVLYFYFNARSGSDMEKNTLGLFQALLHQLILRSPPVPQSLLKTFEQRRETGSNWTWRQNEIIDCFFQTLKQRNHKPVTIFVDALDECGVDGTSTAARDIVRLFETAMSDAIRDGRNVNLCVSGRHYPNIAFCKSIGVIMEDNNQKSISSFIRKSLPSEAELGCSYNERSNLEADLVQKAGGVFLWAKLVMDRMREMFAEGESMNSLKKRAREDTFRFTRFV